MTREEIIKEAREQVNYCTPLYPECFIQGYIASAELREKQIAKLEAENTKLKEKLKPENCLKLLAKEGYVKFTSDRLTKAREIINEYINILKGDTKNWKKTQKKAEQFLKDNEVEK